MKRYRNNLCSSDASPRCFAPGSCYTLFVSVGSSCPVSPRTPSPEALALVEQVCARHFVHGYTILPGTGANRDTPTELEPTVYIMAIEASEHEVFQVAATLQQAFHHGEILIERNQTQYLYFNGQ